MSSTTHYSKFSSEAVSYVTSTETSTIVNGNEVKYSTTKFTYDHEDEDGNITTGDLSFELPEVSIPQGLTLEKGYNLKGRFDFSRESEDASDCVKSKSRTQSKGWVSKSDVDVEMDDDGRNVATPVDGVINVYEKPNKDSKVVGTNETETMTVIGKSPDKKFYSVTYGGQDGFFEQLRKALADIIYENRTKSGIELGGKSKKEILEMFSDPVYIAKNKKTNEVYDRDPAVYFNVIYFPYKSADQTKDGKERQESLANFDVPGQLERLNLQDLKSSAIKCIPTVKILHVTKTGKSLSMKMYITGACVTDIDEIKQETYRRTTKTYEKYSNDDKVVNKMKEKMERLRKLKQEIQQLEQETTKEDAPKEDAKAEEAYNQDTDEEKLEEFNLAKMMDDEQGVFN